MHSSKSKTRRLVAGFVGIALALSVALPAGAAALTQSQVDAIIALLQSFGADATTISNVQASLTGTAPVVTPAPAGSYTFTRNLKQGDTGTDVQNLQKVLNMSADTQVSASGAGSPGNESTYFGAATKAAVIKFQNKYASEVLTPVGLTAGTGFVGAATRAKLNTMGSGPVVGPVVPTGGSLSVAAGTQPAQQLAPQGAARVPFTRFTLTAGSSDVVVNSVTVTRVGPGLDASFAGVVLIDESNMQIGLAKTLNSNHQANIGEPFTVKAGTTRTLTVAGNMAADLSLRAGEVPAFQVTSINTSSPVVGALPITGTGQVTNASLTVGSVTMTESYDPGAQNKPIGTSNYQFGSIKVTGSNEDLRLWSVRWNQSGSASAADLANVVTEVDGIKYPATLSADGKYYTTTFGSGIVIAKGFSKELSVRGDIVSGPGRTVSFDLYRATDLYLSGETYGFGVTPPTSGSSGTFGSTNPWFNGSDVTVQAGSVTTVGKATEVASTNIGINIPNQTLGGFATQFIGEPVTISGLVINFNLSSQDATAQLLTNVSIVDSNGAVVAGPVDATDVGGTEMKATFTDSITFPTSRAVYTIRGTVDPTTSNNQTITASTTPSSWTSPTGQNTGNSVTISQGNFTMNAMTVKTAALAITMSSSPASQSIVSGGNNVLFANVQLDASQSGEDVRLSQIPLRLAVTGAAATTDLTGCQLFDGSTAINTGSNVPTSLDGTDTFSFDAPLTIAKNSVKTLALRCNVATGITGTFRWSVNSSDTFNAIGVASSSDITEVVTTANSGLMTIGSATLVFATDSGSPGYTIAAAGASGVTLGKFSVTATNDDIDLQSVGLKLTNTASSSASDLTAVTLWDGSTQIGTATFTGVSAFGTSTLSTPLRIAKNASKVITVKGNLSAIGLGEAVEMSGHLVAVDAYTSDTDSTSTYGTGVGSGTSIDATGSTAVAGVRVFKSFPTFAAGTLDTAGVTDGKLLRFSVTANSAGPVGISKFSVTLATTSAAVTGLNMFGYTDSSYSQPISGVSSGGQLLASNISTLASAPTVSIYPQTTAGATTTVQIAAGETRYFEVRGTVSPAAATYNITTTLNGDNAYPALSTGTTATATAAIVDGSQGNTVRSFIWSANSTTTPNSTVNDVDWSNGYGLPGLPASGIVKNRTN